MIANLTTRAGNPAKPNLDWCGATPTCAVVLDGVSEPAGTETGCMHGTYWYVQQLGSTLLRYASIVPNMHLDEALATAIQDVNREHGGTCDLGHPGSPAATAVIVRQWYDDLDYLVLSDSTLVLDLDDGLLVVTDPRADRATAGEDQQLVFTLPPGSPEHAGALARMVTAQRARRNREGDDGYWVASTLPEAVKHARTGTVDADRVGSALLASDGVTRLSEWGLMSLDNMLWHARQYGPDVLIEAVRQAERDDPDMTRHPRFSAADDATAVLVVPDRHYRDTPLEVSD